MARHGPARMTRIGKHRSGAREARYRFEHFDMLTDAIPAAGKVGNIVTAGLRNTRFRPNKACKNSTEK